MIWAFPQSNSMCVGPVKAQLKTERKAFNFYACFCFCLLEHNKLTSHLSSSKIKEERRRD